MCVPGGQDLRGTDVGHNMQEVVAHEHSPLQQQEREADAVPDDPGLVTRQHALFVCVLLRCGHVTIIRALKPADNQPLYASRSLLADFSCFCLFVANTTTDNAAHQLFIYLKH